LEDWPQIVMLIRIVWTGSIWLGIRNSGDGNEFSGFTKSGEFLYWVSGYWLPKKTVA